MLYATPPLDDDDRRVLAELSTTSSQVSAQLQAQPRWARQLRRSLLDAAVRGSTAIDHLALADGCRDALAYVWQVPRVEYSETLLSTLHSTIMRSGPSRYRTDDVYVSSGRSRTPAYTAPDADAVPSLMAELVEWLRGGDSDASPYVRAAMGHLHLVSIFPWRAGNGLTARAVHTLVVAKDGPGPEVSIDAWLGDPINSARYFAALRSVQAGSFQPERDAHSWLRFVLAAHHGSAQRLHRRCEWTTRLWDPLARLAGERGLPERVVSALYAAALGEVRRATYQQDEGLSRDQAIRDIQALTRAGLLAPQGNATTRVYLLAGVAGEVAEAAADAVRGAGRDPYA